MSFSKEYSSKKIKYYNASCATIFVGQETRENDICNRIVMGECASSVQSYYGRHEDGMVIVHIPVGFWESGVDVSEDLQKWVDFLNKCYLPCEYIGRSCYGNYNKKHVPAIKQAFGSTECYHIKLNHKDFVSMKHVLSAHTALRYFWAGAYKNIAELAVRLKEENPKWNSITALIVAHYGATPSYDAYKGLVNVPNRSLGSHGGFGYKYTNEEGKTEGLFLAGPPRREDIMERLKFRDARNRTYSVNEIFTQPFNYDKKVEQDMFDAAKRGDFKRVKILLYRQKRNNKLAVPTTGSRGS